MHLKLGRLGGTDLGDSSQQCAGIFILRMVEDLFRCTCLDDPPFLHHRDRIAYVSDNGHVVCDEEVSKVELILQILQKIEHLSLDGDVECRNRFVAD